MAQPLVTSAPGTQVPFHHGDVGPALGKDLFPES